MKKNDAEFSLWSTIRMVVNEAELAGELDKHVLAKEVRELIPDNAVEGVLLVGLAELVRLHFATRRAASPIPTAANEQQVRSVGQSRTAKAADVARSHPFDWPVCPNGRRVLLRFCTRADVEALAAELREMAARHDGRAAQYERLAAVMGGVETVGELSENLVAEVFAL